MVCWLTNATKDMFTQLVMCVQISGSLLEAGNEQLRVISDLTDRVKELEKKLAWSRSKRVKTKRCRPTTSKMSSRNSLNLM